VRFFSTATLGYLGLGVLMGALSACLGIGGGVLITPAIFLLYGKSMQVAVGTSLAAMVFGSLAGAARHASFGNVDWPIAIGIGVGAVLGAALIGAPLAQKIPSAVLAKVFGVVMCAFGLRMIGVYSLIGRAFHH
jgi:uncharacterized membrane protein YfcA